MAGSWQKSARRLFKHPGDMPQALVKRVFSPQRPGLGRLAGRFGAHPDFLIIGTQKGGSTSLYRYLTAHPNVCSAALKEIHYFSHYYACPETWYRAHFAPSLWRKAKKLQTGEASVSYLHVPAAPERVATHVPDVKLIVMLRNPVARAFSHYRMSVKQGHETLSFAEAIALEPERLRQERDRLGADAAFDHGRTHRRHGYLLRGHYAEQLERWFTHFPREQFLILSSERFFNNPAAVYHEVLSFLDLPEVDLPSYRQLNKGGREHPALPAELREQLELYFAPHNARLEQLLGMRRLFARPDAEVNNLRTRDVTSQSGKSPRVRLSTQKAQTLSQHCLYPGEKLPLLRPRRP